MRILVIEDEKRLAFTLADMIGGAGYYTDVSHDGAEDWSLHKPAFTMPLSWMLCFPEWMDMGF